MKYPLLFAYLGRFLGLIGASMLLPVPWAYYYREDPRPLIISALITGLAGLLLALFFKRPKSAKNLVHYREAFALVTIGWILASGFGTLPYLFSESLSSFTDAFFESMSGFTTTGATIIPDIEILPKSVLFWRSLTSWLGGMGIIVLIVALLSQLGVGANQVFQAEAPGAVAEKLTPRVAKTARILWTTYLVMTILQTLLLFLAGMSLFDALCHSFTSMATGGFSTRNLSAGFYSPLIQWIILLFIFLAGANFALYFQAIRGRSLKYFLRDPEFKLYSTIIFIASCFVAWEIRDLYPLGEPLFRNALFQVVSVLTTTGYATADYGGWSPTAQLILLLLMFIGGCSGSTAGGITVGRIRIIFSMAAIELKRLIHPRGVFSIRYGNRSLSDEVVVNVLEYFFLHMLLFGVASLLIVHLGSDYLTAFSGVAATLGNIGPGLGSVGPAGNFAAVSDLSKWIFSFLMLLGRLEIYTVLVLISPAFWRK